MPDQPRKFGLLQAVKLPRKPSLPSLFMSSSSSFLQSYLPSDLPSSRVVSDPVMSTEDTRDVNDDPNFTIHAPSSLLLDDDPFALLISSIPPSLHTHSLLDMGCPSISESVKPCTVQLSPRAHVPRASSARPKSSHGQVRPAHTRPAFTPRPSLPSLRTLAQMNVAVPRKVRKGTVGARLPHEPWDLDLSADSCLPTRSGSSFAPSEENNTMFVLPPAGLPAENEAEGGNGGSSSDVNGQSALYGGSIVTSVDNVARKTQAPDEVVSSLLLSAHDADVGSLPSLSCTTSEPPSSALSRASSLQSSTWPDIGLSENTHSSNNDVLDQKNSVCLDYANLPADGDEDLLSYHSDFDYYYTQSLSDSSDSEQDCPKSTQNVDVTPSPRGSVYQEAHFQPGTSADTMRSLGERALTTHHPRTPHDEHEWRGQCGLPDRYTSGGDRRGSEQEMYRQVSRRSSSRAGKDQGGSRVGGVGSSGDRHHTREASSSATSDFSSSSANEDGNTIYYSIDGVSNGPSRTHSPLQSRIPRTGGGSDDDIPLAQRMPTALKAQKSIRQQLRDERHRRKLDRAKSTHPPPPVPALPPTTAPVVPSSRSLAHDGRKRSASSAAPPRTGSLWPDSSSSQPSPILPEDLSRKLMQLQTSSSGSAEQDLSVPFLRKAKLARSTTTSPTRTRHPEGVAYMQQSTTRGSEAPSQNRSLKSAPPFQRPDRRHAEPSRQPFEAASAQSLGRSMTVGARHSPDDIHGHVSAEGNTRSVRNGRDTHAGHEPIVRSGRVSEDNWRPSGSASRPSVDRESNTSNQRVVQRLPLPAVTPPSTSPLQPSKVSVTQQRIFIGDMQRFNTVEIASNTTAGHVVKLMTSQGILDKSGSWMVFELAQDYGMERPVRDYELLSDVSASWDKDKLLNAFVIKPTPLARLLSPSAIPSCSPTHRGWIEWESKRGKWSKRWMELREHGLWLSKRDTGKDETFLCSVSNFDAYYVTRRHKSPKPFVFAIKSTDHLSLFENAADYLHVFSCNQRDGEKWMEAILVARSYVLHQEKHVLCTGPTEVLSQAKPLSRTRTRKQSVSGRPAQPLINVPPPFSVSPTANVVFEPGSLLAKRKGDPQT